MDGRVLLKYRVERLERGDIELSYDLRNQDNTDIYIFSPLTDYRGQDWVPVPGRVYVFWDKDRTVHLTKRLWPVPDDVEVYMPEVPELTRVPAGEKLEGHLTLPVPLLINFPYHVEEKHPERSPKGEAIEESNGLVFSLGYLSIKDGPFKLDEISTGTGRLTVSYGVGIENQHIVQGERIPLRVKVRE
jgi:hypothetical protein